MLVKARHLVKNFGFDDNKVIALNDVSLDIKEGTFTVILGRSGSGKSTLLHILAGLIPPSKGEVIIEGHSLYKMTDNKLTIFRRKRMGFVFQFFNLVTTQNVIENIVLPIHLDKGKVDIQYVEEIIQILGLTEKRTAFIHELSGGQQQRVAIARALASKPAIIFADEPTGNLDGKSAKEVIELLKLAQKKYRGTIVLVTHDESIAAVADRVIRIEDGQIVEDVQK